MIYSILIFLAIIFFIYWFYFIKSEKVTKYDFLAICKTSNNPVVLKIDLMESAKYISFIKQKKENEILYIDVYTTSVFNIFPSSKKASIEIKDLNGIKEVVLVNKKYDISLFKECR